MMPTSDGVLKLPFVCLSGITKDIRRMNRSIFYKYRIIWLFKLMLIRRPSSKDGIILAGIFEDSSNATKELAETWMNSSSFFRYILIWSFFSVSLMGYNLKCNNGHGWITCMNAYSWNSERQLSWSTGLRHNKGSFHILPAPNPSSVPPSTVWLAVPL